MQALKLKNEKMSKFRYVLMTGSQKYLCPLCGKKSFKPYVDTITGEILANQYGRCDHENKCAYHLNPYKDGYAKTIAQQELKIDGVNYKPNYFYSQPKPTLIYFDYQTFSQTLQHERYAKNKFIINMLYRMQFNFDLKEIVKVVELYKIGTITNGYMEGAVTFPYIDEKNNVRAIQVKKFDENNHTIGTDFLHSILTKHHQRKNQPMPEWLIKYSQQEKRVSCLFGAHLLHKYPKNPIALVEAPKTAIYAWLYFNQFPPTKNWIWMAVYNKSSFSFDKIEALKGRTIYVFPDLSQTGSTYKEWEIKANDFEKLLPGTKFVFSDLLEKMATPEQREQGADIADVLINYDWRNFRNTKTPTIEQPIAEIELHQILTPSQKNIQPDWDKSIAEIETFFAGITLPTQPIKLNQCSTITNVPLFLERHLATIKANQGNMNFLPYLNRLQNLKEILSN